VYAWQGFARTAAISQRLSGLTLIGITVFSTGTGARGSSAPSAPSR